MAMNKARRTANLNNILTYDTLGNSTLIANLTVEGLTGAGFVKADAAGLLSVDTAAYTVVTGATNYLTKITAPNTLGQSLVYDNGTSVLVNTAVGVPGYSHAFQVMANGAGGLVVSTTDVASAIGIVNSSSANKTWDISPYGNHLVINESGVATRIKFDAGGNITIGDITNSGHKLEVIGSFRTTGTNTLSALQGVGDRMVVANTNGVLTTQPIPTGSITGTGAAGQVNFWTGTTTVSGSNNLFWDNTNGRLGIGTNAPITQLNVNQVAGGVKGLFISGDEIFATGNGATNKGIRIALGVSRTGNRQLWMGDNDAFGSSTLSIFRYQTGVTGYGVLDSVTGDGSARLLTIIGSETSNIGAGFDSTTPTSALYTAKLNVFTFNTANSNLQIRKFGTATGNYLDIVNTSGTTIAFLNNSGNLNIGSTDLGTRLGVVGDTILRGSGATDSTTALTVQDSASVNLFRIRNGGTASMLVSSAQTAPVFQITQRTTNTNGSSFIRILRYGNAFDDSSQHADILGYWDTANTSGFRFQHPLGTGGGVTFNFIPAINVVSSNVVTINQTFNPTSGAFTITQLLLSPTINQTGGANGITRGLYVNPTLTAAADWRSIEWSNNTGWGLYGAGTANNYLAGNLSVGTLTTTDWVNIGASTTTKAQIFLTAGVDPTTPTDGDIWATSTDIKARVAGTTYSLINSGLSGSGTAGQVTYWSSASGLTGSANLFWDNTNGRLGIGTNTPANRLVVFGSGTSQVRIGVNDTAYWEFGRDNVTTGDLVFTNNVSGVSYIGFRVKQATGRFIIGSNDDLGQRLQVTGDALVRGSGNTSATTALSVQNSDSSNMLQILNNGYIRLGNLGNASFRIYSSTVASGGDVDLNGEFLTLNSRSVSTETGSAAGFIHINGVNAAAISGIQNVVSIQKGFAPTSGSAIHTSLIINPNINQTGGANGVTRGVYVNPTLTAAADWRSIQWDNNTGWGLYGAGTAPNYMAGTLGIGAGASVGYNFVVARNITGNIESGGIRQYGAVLADVSTVGIGIRNQLNVGAGVALNSYQHYRADVFSFGAGATLVTQIGFLAENTLTNATNNYGFFGNIAAATGRWNLYMAGTANNYMAGRLGIGSTNLAFASFRVSNAVTGGVNSTSIFTDSVIQSDVTSSGTGYYSGLQTAAASFTLDSMRHFYAEAGTFGAGSVVTTQIGFGASSNLTAATNNYGFFGGIPSGTNRWNLYMSGTANNYLNGSLLIGSATDDTVNKLQVTGTIVAGSGSSTAGSVILRGSYSAGYLTILGTDASSGGPMLSYGIQSAQNSTAGAFVSSSAIAIPRSAYVQNGGHIWYTAPSSSTAIGTAVVPTKHMELYNSGNLVLGGGADDAVNRLQVGGNAFIKGTGNTSATTALTVQNSSSTDIFRVRNDGQVGVNSVSNFIGRTIELYGTTSTNITYAYIGGTLTTTSGSSQSISIGTIFQPTSGTSRLDIVNIAPSINQTGGANGITRGVYVNPILTSAADWRSIEWSNNTGWGLYGVGTAKNYLNGTTLIGTTTDDGINKLQVAGSIASAGIMRSDAARTAATNDVSIALLGSNITTYTAGFTMGAAGYGLNAVYAQHEQRFGGNATFDAGNLNGAGLMLNRLAPTAAGTITMNQQAGRIRTMSNLHLQTQIQGNNNITVTHMSGLHIYGHYRTTGTITLTVGDYYGVLLADPNEFSTGPTITGTNWGFYQQGAAPNNHFGGKVLIGTTTVGTSPLRISGLPTSAAGLGAGEIWNNGGVLTVV